MMRLGLFTGAALLVAFGIRAPLCAQGPDETVAVSYRDTVEQRTFFSVAMNRAMPYQVVLPVGYGAGQQRYAVLYLLHGWQGDETNWVRLTHLVEAASQFPLIVVTPRADNSWYVNSATQPQARYSDYIVNDLIADVDVHYRTIATAHERAIAGLSMGGYGALLFALRHPGMFGFTASISGAFGGPSGIERVMPALKPSTDEAYGHANSATRRENDLDLLIPAADPKLTPYLFLECGTTDPLLEENRHVAGELSTKQLAYEYHELPGAHTWAFWDRSLPALLGSAAEHLGLELQVPAQIHHSQP